MDQPSLQEILAKTRLKIDDFPGQIWASRALAGGMIFTALTYALAAPAFFSSAWKARIAEPLIWIFATSLLFNGVAVLLFMSGVMVSFLNATHIRAGQFDRQHADEQAHAADLAASYSRAALERIGVRLQLEIDGVENTKAVVAAFGGLVGALTPIGAFIVRPGGGLEMKPAELGAWIAAAGVGSALSLLLTLRFRDHLARAKHVVQEAMLRLAPV